MQDVLTVLLSLSFTAGLLSFVNPCGFALLPAYAAFYLGSRPGSLDGGINIGLLIRGTWIGAMATLGFILVFISAGLIISSTGVWILRAAPWISGLIGAVVLLLGILLAAGKNPLPSLTIDVYRLSVKSRRYIPIFGAVYAVASLSCTLPVSYISPSRPYPLAG